MKPLLAHVYEPKRIPDGVPLYVQPKLNGVRALAGTDNQGRWRFQSRDEIPWDYEILEHLSVELHRLGVPKDWVLDGELYVHGWPLQKILGAITPVRKETRGDTVEVEYHLFDRVDYQKSFIDRYQQMANCIGSNSFRIKLVPTRKYPSLFPGTPEGSYSLWVGVGYEGMMYRIGDCPYTRPKQPYLTSVHHGISGLRTKFLSDRNNRCWHLLKRKDWQDGEFACVGVEEGEGKRQGMVGSFTCSVKVPDPDGKFTQHKYNIREFSVGSFLGFTDADLTHLLTNPPIGKKLKIKYLCLSEEGKPLNPTLLAIL